MFSEVPPMAPFFIEHTLKWNIYSPHLHDYVKLMWNGYEVHAEA